MNPFKRSRALVVGIVGLVALAACTGGGSGASAGASAAASGGGGGEGYHIGVSNTLTNNGWREEMICSINAQAAASGDVSELTVFHRDTDAAGQLEDLRNLIAEGVDAIIVNPVSPDAVNEALAEANEAGIPVISVDQAVTEESAYLIANNQEEYAYLGATWLFEAMGGSGDVVYMRGFAGHPADDDRDVGFQRALDEHPDINVVHEVHTGWDQATGTQQINDFLATGQNYDGIWTSGIDNVIVDALVAADAELVPIVGADNAGFVQQLIEVDGLVGAAVTNPASVGGAGVTLALQLLNGEEPESQEVLMEPVLWANDTEEGMADLEAANDPDIDPTWPLGISIEGWTDYSKDDILACEGP
ncbi:MAG TPA: substrate-binding domain-containing protein [Candidatus Limnocylindria bacterium]|nr:substrate-binding domain-containing protein [Candidatus Limnocylindria bacterium]